MSVPGQMNDPCPQDNAACLAVGGKAYAMCVDGQWAKTCDCIAASTGTSTQPVTMTPIPMATCGDGTITAPTEKCEGTNLNGATCQSLGYNGGGTLLCNKSTCNYDIIMCRMTTGGGAGTNGGGAGMGGGGTGS